MKWNKLLLVPLCGICFSSAIANVSPVVNVSAELKDMTCQIGTGSENTIVNLPAVTTSELIANRTPGYTEFTLEFKGCQNLILDNNASRSLAGKTLYAMFVNANDVDTANQNTLRNIAPANNRARNVNIQLVNTDTNRTPIKVVSGRSAMTSAIANSYKGQTIATNKTTYTVRYGARYYRTGNGTGAQAPTPGLVQATATFSANYR